jgi:hypothetical protein
MLLTRRFSSRLALLPIIALLLLAACSDRAGSGSDEQSDGDAAALIEDATERDDAPAVDPNAPDPAPVDADDLELIDEWREAGVPRYRDGQVLDFEPHASRIENGGTLLLDGVDDSAEEIIAFYRGALQALGWEERNATATEITAHTDIASLLLVVSEHDHETHILMILTDRPQRVE